MRSIDIVAGLGLLLLACGGKAVIDPAGSGGAAASNASSSDNSSSSSGPQPQCDRIDDCCDLLCDAALSLPCWDGDRACECDTPTVPPCRQALRALYQCMVSGLPSSLMCNEGEPQIACGACEAEIDAVPEECGVDLIRCAP